MLEQHLLSNYDGATAHMLEWNPPHDPDETPKDDRDGKVRTASQHRTHQPVNNQLVHMDSSTQLATTSNHSQPLATTGSH